MAVKELHKVNLEVFSLQVLTGHQENAEFALAMCPTEPLVLSGGLQLLVMGFYS